MGDGKRQSSPNWPALRAVAAVQGGYFRIAQAAEAGFSAQLLAVHVLNGNLLRPRRGIYRFAQAAHVEHEDLVELWLWSDQEGVFSHETALALHELSDALPARVHLTLPRAWRTRRRTTPSGLVVYYTDLPSSDRTWLGLIPLTTPQRTLRDAEDAGVNPDIIAQAIRDGAARRLFTRADLRGLVPPRVGRPPRHLRARPRSSS